MNTQRFADMERVLRRRDLFGRDQAGTDLHRFLTRAACDGGALVLAGDPGVGKSALLDTAGDMASVIGAQVMRAAGTQRQARSAYATLDSLLSPLSTRMEGLPADQRSALEVTLGLGSGPLPGELLVAHATLSLLRTVTQSQPLLVLLDDAQWMDPQSALILGLVARRLQDSQVMLLAAQRASSHNSPPELDASDSSPLPGFASYEVVPLDEDAAAELLTSRFPDLSTVARERVLAEARGNPLALIELSSALGINLGGAQQLLPEVLPASDDLVSLFTEQLHGLPPSTQEVLLLSALQTAGDLSWLSTALPHLEVLDALAPAERVGVVVIRRNRYLHFRHPLVRSSLVRRSSDVEVRRAHRTLAEVAIDHPHLRAWHLARAATAPDEQVAQALDAASVDSFAHGDPHGAVRRLTRAAELSQDRDARGRRLVEAAYICAVVTGALAEASSLLHSARETDRASIHTLRGAIATASLILNTTCDVDSAHRLLLEAIRRHDEPYSADDGDLIDALYALFMVCWYSGSAKHWDPFQELMKQIRPAAPKLLALAAKCIAAPLQQPPATWDELDAATAALHAELDPGRIARTAVSCVYTDRTSACREGLWRVIEAGRGGGAVALSLSAITSSCVDDWLSGHWDEGLDLAAEGVNVSQVHGYRRFTYMLSGYIRPLILVTRGEANNGLDATDAMAAWGASQHVGMFSDFAHHVRILHALAADDYTTAFQHASAISPPGELRRYTPHALWVLLDLVESAVMSGRLDDAHAHVAAMKKAEASAISPRVAMVVAACSALTSDTEKAQHLFEQSVSTPGAERTPFDLGRIQLLYGKHLRRSRNVPEARSHLLEALDIFDHLQAQPWAQKARDELRAAGLAEDSPPHSDARLTPQELEIARLAAAGFTNRDIAKQLYLSDRTVGARLYRLFPKLGITSRAALHDALVASGIDLTLPEEPRTAAP
ncbi:AAA family ATPase [Streptomyces sp. NPDC001914]|uniref:helix-turn-helix transcriptional regulator n=1 Tax=Streptomyces sp. NPDC001914 TaxID=3364623 RepID=UPI00367903D5